MLTKVPQVKKLAGDKGLWLGLLYSSDKEYSWASGADLAFTDWAYGLFIVLLFTEALMLKLDQTFIVRSLSLFVEIMCAAKRGNRL